MKKKNVLGAIRTRNRLLRKQVLYPLSYEDVSIRIAILTPFSIWVKVEFSLTCWQLYKHVVGFQQPQNNSSQAKVSPLSLRNRI